jgi:hypothetical protein
MMALLRHNYGIVEKTVTLLRQNYDNAEPQLSHSWATTVALYTILLATLHSLSSSSKPLASGGSYWLQSNVIFCHCIFMPCVQSVTVLYAELLQYIRVRCIVSIFRVNEVEGYINLAT